MGYDTRASCLERSIKKIIIYIPTMYRIICDMQSEILLTNAEVGKDIVQDGVTCDVGSGDFANGRDRTTQVGRQQVCGKAIR